MFGIIAFILFLIALIICVIEKGTGTDMKFAYDCAFAGGAFLGLAMSRWGNWQRGW
jgi:hypothetical protein